MKWSKLLTNLLANASAAILGMTPGEIFRDPQLFAMEMRQIREALAVMKGLDCNVIDLPGTPIRALTWLAKNVSPVISHPLLKPFLIRGRGDKLPSLYLDMAQGKTKSEVGYLNGAVARFGEALDVATPVNKMLNKILTQMLLDEQVRKQFHRNPQALLRSI
jgi:2-dehydropantoate 2-reductase